MKLAASNIAWPAGADAEAATILARHGATGVELAPGKVWAKPTEATAEEIAAVRRWWEDRGIRVVACQALLFGRPDLLLFADEERRDRFADYLSKIIRLAAAVGAGPLVFGSPKNRALNGLSRDVAWPVAVEFFRRVGRIAADNGTTIGLEHVPPAYGCDFINTVAEAAELVRAVDSPGFGLHLDAGGMAMTGGEVADAGDVRPVHFHTSEPGMRPIGDTPGMRHNDYAAALCRIEYDGCVSIEVREPAADWQGALERSIIATKAAYG